MITDISFLIILLIKTIQGFWCSFYLNSKFPLALRLIILSPCLSALDTMWDIFNGAYVPYSADLFRGITSILLYLLIIIMLIRKDGILNPEFWVASAEKRTIMEKIIHLFRN